MCKYVDVQMEECADVLMGEFEMLWFENDNDRFDMREIYPKFSCRLLYVCK